MGDRREKLPIAALERIDDLCAEFEDLWRRGTPPSIESILPRAASSVERSALLGELVLLEMDYRRQRGEQPAAQEYLDRFPNDVDTIRRALTDSEDRARASRFEPPTVARLAELFPALEILELIGVGGMGAVYKARQIGLDRMVALKILPEEFGHDPKFALRFTREARALAKLNHPHIVSVYEFGHVGDTHYFLMEYVDGTTLRAMVQGRLLRPEQALAIVPDLCDALQYAHDQGVVHRDIKPENILLSKDGNVKIADFGLSRLLGSESLQEALTATHQVMGTPRYMAPEQLEGTHLVDHRADIYSLGVVFYEMLTGELPIGRFSAPSEKVKIDVRLDDVVLRALEKEPQRRYQRASQVKSDVESITSADPSALSPTMELKAAANRAEHGSRAPSLERQELAGRLLLVRRELLGRVEKSLRPLFWGQILQMLIGVGITALGVACWVRNQHIPHRLFSGGILHLYGILMVLAAGVVCTRIKRLDYSRPVIEIRAALDKIRKAYLQFGAFLGLAWWLLWIPVCVAIGFDAVAYSPAVWISVAIGVIGLALSTIAYVKFLKSQKDSAERWRTNLAGESLRAAYRALDEVVDADIG